MKLGMTRLGRMETNLTRRLMRDGHEVVVFDAGSVRQLESEGAAGTTSLEEFVARLDAPRTAWIMVRRASPRKRPTGSPSCPAPAT